MDKLITYFRFSLIEQGPVTFSRLMGKLGTKNNPSPSPSSNGITG